MALTGAEKTQIAQGGLLAAEVATIGGPTIAFEPGVTVVGGFGPLSLPALAFLPPIIGLTAFFNRIRFPKGPTEKELFGPIRALEARGLEARISRDPFFGTTVISTADQAPFLDELVRNAAVNRLAARQNTSELFAIRQGVIEGLAETAQERGFARTIDPSFRGGVFRETEDSPLQVVER